MHPEILSRRTIIFVNIAHALDHFVLLIYPTAVIAIVAERGLDYGTLIGFATGAFVAFGLCSLPMMQPSGSELHFSGMLSPPVSSALTPLLDMNSTASGRMKPWGRWPVNFWMLVPWFRVPQRSVPSAT